MAQMARKVRLIQDRPVVWYTLAALIVLAQLADALTTRLILRAGGGEANRLARALFAQGAFGVVALAKLALACALALLLVAFARAPLARRSPAGAVALCGGAVLTLAYYLILGNNLAVALVLWHLV